MSLGGSMTPVNPSGAPIANITYLDSMDEGDGGAEGVGASMYVYVSTCPRVHVLTCPRRQTLLVFGVITHSLSALPTLTFTFKFLPLNDESMSSFIPSFLPSPSLRYRASTVERAGGSDTRNPLSTANLYEWETLATDDGTPYVNNVNRLFRDVNTLFGDG